MTQTSSDGVVAPDDPSRNVGHGLVWPRPDGHRARCGGPLICRACMSDAALKAAQISDSRAALADARASLAKAVDVLRGDGPVSRSDLAEMLADVLADLEGA